MSRPKALVVLFALSLVLAACNGGSPLGGDGDVIVPGNPATRVTVPDDYATIQAALDAIVHIYNTYTIVVRNGTYTGTGNKNLDFNALNNTPDFSNKAITLRSENGPVNCIIDCESSGRGFYFHSGETSTIVVDGFTITGGNVTEASDGGGDGGGIFCFESSPTITDCIIRGNRSETVIDTGGGGGGIYCESSSPTITSCTITGNLVSGPGEDDGGGILSFDSSPTITDCIIAGNTAEFGGGISSIESSSMICGSVITANTADLAGGGIDFFALIESQDEVSDCTISGNSAEYAGGGIYCESSSPTISASIISGNSAAGGGGICCLLNSSPELVNCIISGNMVDFDGGGIACVDSSSPAITHCTIGDNVADSAGGGIFSFDFAAPVLTNCILWNDSAPNGNEMALASDGGTSPGGLTTDNCDIEGGNGVDALYEEPPASVIWDPSGNINSDPLFNALISGTATAVSYSASIYQSTLTDSTASFTPGALVGRILVPDVSDGSQFVITGNTATTITAWGDITQVAETSPIFDDYEVKDYHITAASPCIDQGSFDPAVTDDIDGDTRPTGVEVDMGADEYTSG